MVVFLGLVAVLSYLVAAFSILAAAAHGTDIQLILSGVCATCGTVAAAGCTVIRRLDSLIQHQKTAPKPTVVDELVHEIAAEGEARIQSDSKPASK